MNDFLTFEERIRFAITIGESLYREFKSALEGPPGSKKPRDIKEVKTDVGRTLVAFANADGGELIIGVEDDGTISGVPFNDQQIATILDASTTHIHPDTPLPSPRKQAVEIDGKKVIYFNVTKGTEYIYLTSDGRCLKRIDRDSMPVSSEKITTTRLEDQSRKWDRDSADGLTLADLNLDLIKNVISQIVHGVSIEKGLQYLDLAEFTFDGIRLKKAAYILFAKDIKKWHSGCYVRIMTVKGKEKRSGTDFNISQNNVIHENVLELIEKSWEGLKYALSMHTQLTDSVKFQQVLMFPEIACREALINAIVHRNYAIEGRGIEISIYQDRMEILSPGMLLTTISLTDIVKLTGAHESRNPLIARVLREFGYIQEIGEGMRRIFNVMRSSALAEPVIENTFNGFSVTLHHKSLYDPNVKLWLSTFDEYLLTENQQAIMSLGYGGREFSMQEIMNRLGIEDTGKVTSIITPLRSKNLIERTKTDQESYNYAKATRIPKRQVPTFKVVNQEYRSQNDTVNQTDKFLDGNTYWLHLSSIEYSATKKDISDWIDKYAKVDTINLPSGSRSGNINRGFAFVLVSGVEDIQGLLVQLNGYILNGRSVNVRLRQ
jgi:ATP-dependent DNA helicase RecG